MYRAVKLHGFKPGSRTTDNLFIFYAIIDKYQATRKPLYVCYLDFKSAFALQGFMGKMFSLLRNLFGKSQNQSKWNSEVGDLFDNMHDVLQGGTASPTLFKIYVDDMQTAFDAVSGVIIGGMAINHPLQADDLILISETSVGLQKLLARFDKYCNSWHILLNVTKTKTMVFNKRFQIAEVLKYFNYNVNKIEECSEYKYLGVIFSRHGQRFESYHAHIANKAQRAIITCRTTIHGVVGNKLPSRVYIKTFNQQIRPILEYASETWFQTNADRRTWTRAIEIPLEMLWVSPRVPLIW